MMENHPPPEDRDERCRRLERTVCARIARCRILSRSGVGVRPKWQFGAGPLPEGGDLLSRLSDDTRQMLDRLMASGGISAETAASAIDYFAKLKNNQDVADTMPTPAAAATAGGLGEALARLETGLKEGGDTLTRDIDAYRRASAAYRRESLDTLHKRLAAGMQGYKLEELSAGAAIRNTPLGDALARDAGVDLSRGAL